MLPTRSVGPIHFEDYDGHLFERLVFAYLLRTDSWRARAGDIVAELKWKGPRSERHLSED